MYNNNQLIMNNYWSYEHDSCINYLSKDFKIDFCLNRDCIIPFFVYKEKETFYNVEKVTKKSLCVRNQKVKKVDIPELIDPTQKIVNECLFFATETKKVCSILRTI